MQNKNSPEVILDQYSKALTQQVKAHPDSIPEEFLFSSKVIVLSEETEIPPYLPEGVLAFQLNYSKDRAVESIDQNLEIIATEFPDFSLEDKKEVLNFIRKNRPSGKEIDLPTFIRVGLVWKTRDPNREAWMLAQLQ